MKIAYLISHDIGRNDGVTKKIKGQTDEWFLKGHEVKVFAYVPQLRDSILNASQYVTRGQVANRLTFDHDYYRDLEEYGPDIVYFRYDTWSLTLDKILRRYKVVAELNTFDLGEFYLLLKQQKTLKSLLRFFAYRVLRGRVLSKVRGLVTVTHEIANHSSNSSYEKPTICIPNAIKLDDFSRIKSPDCEKNALFFIGTPNQPWHGIDVIVRLAQQLPEFEFHLVGIEGESGENIFFHGYLSKEDYFPILERCSICIGSLAMQRNNMLEGCPLKVREYLALGFPIIIGYEDTAFGKNNPDWVFSADFLDESQEYLQNFSKFVRDNQKNCVPHSSLNGIALENTEKKRLNFFDSVS